MGQFSVPTDASIKSESESANSLWSEEHERVPLKQRLKLLLANNRIPKSGIGMAVISEPQTNIFVRSYGNQRYSQEEKNDLFEVQQNDTGEMKECVSQTEGDEIMCQMTADNIMLGKVDAANSTSLRQMLPSHLPIKTKVSDANSLKKCIKASSGADMETSVAIKNEITDDVLDDLDFVVLKERQRMLLSRKSLSLERKTVEGTSPALSNLAEDDWVQGNDLLCSVKKTLPEQESSHKLNLPSDSSNARPSSDIVSVKLEPLESTEFETTGKHATGNPSYNFSLPMKNEEVPYASSIDELDHMLLRERMKLFSQNVCTSSWGDGISASSSKIVPSMVDSTPIASVAAKQVKVNRPRKRRKTATDSVELALEEDAPGLLKVLLEKGVSVDEIKLYGEPESNESLDDLSTEDSFTELEEIVSKLFSRRPSLLKLPAMHFSKGEKASYCLACLFSLVEQARHLLLRKWPVEWGWCRDLQSFIFVFERHNRIVLERPEYGYATYFFELVESIPIHWQIRRLITSMKLTTCSRLSLIENRALLVGEDLSEGEAKVLMGYGWVPNTGLGSMLNYCDRVVHDRNQQDKDSSEWRTKIGKMLVDGYNGGKIEPTETPASLAKYSVADDTDVNVKLEFD